MLRSKKEKKVLVSRNPLILSRIWRQFHDNDREEMLKGTIVRFDVVEPGICVKEIFAHKAPARILEYERPEGFITHARALFLGSIAHEEEKSGRQAGGRWGREQGSRNEKKKEEKREERPISSAVEFHERAIAADVRSAEELCGREIPRE